MSSRLYSRAARFAVAVTLLVAFSGQLAVAAAVGPERGARTERRGFNLYAEVFTLFLVNRVACGINNLGEVCVDPGNSPIGGGGFWPTGTPDQYIFNSGLQAAGIISAGAGFEWAGDTVGAYFMDPRGTQQQGDGVTPVFNSLDPVDAQDWPNGGIVRDAAIFDSVLLGRQAVSQQDLWVRAWDGNPSLLSGRTHPMGIMVEMRGMAWNFPTGNEDILYFIFRFYNVTASDPAAYANLDPSIRDEIAAVGAQFQAGVQQTLGVNIPDGGYTIENFYSAFFMDPDVEDASHNFSTAVLPFQLAVAYKHDWLAPTWVFPADIFGAPFAPAPGFVGVKYLRSPVDPNTGQELGIALFSNTRNSSQGFPDPVGVVQLWRYLSGNIDPSAGDLPCTVPNPIQRKLCFLDQVDADTRFYQSAGPSQLAPGDVGTIVVAYVHAAPVAAAINPGTSMRPGIPPSGAALAAGTDTIRSIDRAVGWISHSDLDGNASISQDEVVSVPRSLLQKSLVAQAVFDNKFLLPFAPEPPNFFLVPGDDQVTIVWEASPTETLGDPFFQIAANATSALFDPNFREFDVEGYRIYRGRTPGALSLIAQFDYASTTFTDFTGAINYGNCAPELGIFTDCPVTFDFPISATGATNDVPLSGNVIQVPPGGRVLLSDMATIITLNADTAVTGLGATFPALSNSGVPFAFVDRGVRNSLTYFYAVTAFDVNSIASGPTSLESARITKSTAPRKSSPNVVQARLVTGIAGDDGELLDLAQPSPTIDPQNGTFSGPFPPTNAFAVGFAPIVSRLLPAFTRSATIDSIQIKVSSNIAGGTQENPSPECPEVAAGLAASPFGACYTYHISLDVDGAIQPLTLNAYSPWWGAFGEPPAVALEALRATVAFDSTSLAQFGIPPRFSSQAAVDLAINEAINNSVNAGPHNRRFSQAHGGSRWYDGDPEQGANETVADPARFIRVGSLAGVDTVWAPISHTPPDAGLANPNIFEKQCFNRALGFLGRSADIRFTWTGGTVSEVRDVTHRTNVRFSPSVGVTWGFLTTDANGNGVLDWQDFNYIETAHQMIRNVDGGNCNDGAGTRWDPAGTFTTVTLSNTPAMMPTSTAGLATVGPGNTQTGMGFGLFVLGERFIFEMSSLPADGTVWTLRQYAGSVTVDDESAADPSGYSYSPNVTGRSPGIRPGMVEGITFVFESVQPTVAGTLTQANLDSVHTVPDPYYVTSALEITTNRKVLKFVNLPPQAIIRIYSLSGVLIDVLEHNDVSLGGESSWNLRNRNNQFVASGVYFYHIETPEGLEKIGRFTVVNFAQ